MRHATTTRTTTGDDQTQRERMTNRERDKERQTERERERENVDMDSFTTHCHAVLHGGMRGAQQLRIETLTFQFQLIASHRRYRWLNAAATTSHKAQQHRRRAPRTEEQSLDRGEHKP